MKLGEFWRNLLMHMKTFLSQWRCVVFQRPFGRKDETVVTRGSWMLIRPMVIPTMTTTWSRNATGFDAINTAVSLYSNLRVLCKSFNYVNERAPVNRWLLWTIWHLEMLKQLEPILHQRVRKLASVIESIAGRTYGSLGNIKYKVGIKKGRERLIYLSDKGGTLFAIYRSFFWENARRQVDELAAAAKTDPQSREAAELLREILTDTRQMDFLIVLTLLPFKAADYEKLVDIRRKRIAASRVGIRRTIEGSVWLFDRELLNASHEEGV